MADIFVTTFPGTTLPGTMSTDHRNGGSHAVSGGNLTLTTAASATSCAIARQTTAVAMADGDTATVRYVSDTAGGTTVIALRTGTGDGLFLPNVSVNGGGQWYTRAFRISTGPGATRVTGSSAATRPWVRFRRAGTSVVVETATDSAGSPGAWTTLDTWLDTDGLWVSSFAAVQVEVAAYTPTAAAQSLTISRIGVSSLNPTDLQLRFTAGALSIDSAVMPEAAGGGGLTTLFASDWGTATGVLYPTAISDGGLWDNQITCSRDDVLSVVTASSVDPTWTRSANLLRVNWATTESGCGAIQRLNAVGTGQSHYGRLFYRRVDRTYGLSLHNFSYNFLGTIQMVFFNPVVQPFGAAGVAADGWCWNHGGQGQTYPFDQWRCQSTTGTNPLSVPFAKFAYDAWFLYEWHWEYVTPTTYRFRPRISSYNTATDTATLLFTAANMYPVDNPNGITLEAWLNAGNVFTITDRDPVLDDAQLSRNIGIGNEGRVSHPLNTTMHYVADFKLGTGGWLGTSV